MNRDGGPAFPVIVEGGELSGLHPEFDSGMSLRDWFAGQALSALINSLHVDTTTSNYVFAEAAYQLADAMLNEREKIHD